MEKVIKTTAVLSSALTILFAVLYLFSYSSILLALAITLGTIAYHLLMRLLVGWLLNCIFHNRVDHGKAWFRPKGFEKKLYAALGVKGWKGKLPSYDPSLFSLEQHSLKEIVGAMCQAELVHEVIVVLSFLPLAFTPVFGELWVFLLTSLIAACFDLLFVMMQRYNRPRLVRLLERQMKHCVKD